MVSNFTQSHSMVKSYLRGLRSAVGEREQRSGDGETAGTQSERNAAAEPQTEVIPHPVLCRMSVGSAFETFRLSVWVRHKNGRH